MADPLIITALLAKRKELLRAITVQETQIRKLKNDVVTVSETLRLFDPEYPGGAPRRHVKPNSANASQRLLRHGELGRTILEVLRTTRQEMTASELATVIAHEKDIDLSKPRDAHNLAQSIRRYLDLSRPEAVTRGLRGRMVTYQISKEEVD
jgi:hypothetical protein